MSIVRRRLRELRYSRRTEETYAYWIVRYVRFHDRRHPRDMGADEVRHFLSSLAADEGVAASTQNLALAGLRFLYERVRRIWGGLLSFERTTRRQQLASTRFAKSLVSLSLHMPGMEKSSCLEPS
ncbi:MAG TPA: phage integrase N-terminal SAM-like domain-containing protein [Gemmatimonadaceae bacterium]